MMHIEHEHHAAGAAVQEHEHARSAPAAPWSTITLMHDERYMYRPGSYTLSQPKPRRWAMSWQSVPLIHTSRYTPRLTT
jgi:hypothetical protein